MNGGIGSASAKPHYNIIETMQAGSIDHSDTVTDAVQYFSMYLKTIMPCLQRPLLIKWFLQLLQQSPSILIRSGTNYIKVNINDCKILFYMGLLNFVMYAVWHLLIRKSMQRVHPRYRHQQHLPSDFRLSIKSVLLWNLEKWNFLGPHKDVLIIEVSSLKGYIHYRIKFYLCIYNYVINCRHYCITKMAYATKLNLNLQFLHSFLTD